MNTKDFRIFILLLLCLVLTLQGFTQKEGRLEIRNYTFKNEKNKPVSLHDFKGKVVILDFWASWCQSCIYSFPTTTEVIRKLEGKGVILLTINTDKQRSKWTKALRKHQIPGIALYAKKNHPILSALAIQQLPRYIILDKNGRVYEYMAKSPNEEKENILTLLKE